MARKAEMARKVIRTNGSIHPTCGEDRRRAATGRPTGRRRMPRVIHFEIPVDDPERALTFYRSIFGWQIDKYPGPTDYWLITTGPDEEPGINGAMMPREGSTGGSSPTAFICWVGVPSVDEYIRKVTDAGGKAITIKMVVPHVGWTAYCLDTEGNQFGIIQPDDNAA
jgi:predicted enzyme related to lactoylglutathione lyase